MEGFLAEVRLFSGDFAPKNWEFCFGQLLSVTEYDQLFSLLGNRYGGDGRTTFALPDLKGRAAIGAGQGSGLTDRTLGEKMGQESVTLQTSEMPSHNHAAFMKQATADLYTSSAKGTSGTPAAGNAISSSDTLLYGANTPNVKMASGSVQNVSATILIGNKGGSRSHNNMQPSLVLNYIICTLGVYPVGD